MWWQLGSQPGLNFGGPPDLFLMLEMIQSLKIMVEKVYCNELGEGNASFNLFFCFPSVLCAAQCLAHS